MRLAIVRFLTTPFSRKDSLSNMVGGDFRLGTDSMYIQLAPLDTWVLLSHVYKIM